MVQTVHVAASVKIYIANHAQLMLMNANAISMPLVQAPYHLQEALQVCKLGQMELSFHKAKLYLKYQTLQHWTPALVNAVIAKMPKNHHAQKL